MKEKESRRGGGRGRERCRNGKNAPGSLLPVFALQTWKA
jgi:hypothetical protein